MSGVDLFYSFQFLRRLTTPFNKMDAFKTGVIDSDGKLLKSPKTPEEKNSYTSFDRLVVNLKRLLGKLPGGKTSIASYAAAMFLLKEQQVMDEKGTEHQTQNYMIRRLNEEKLTLRQSKFITEDAPTVAVGSGHIAGAGVGSEGEPGVPRKRKKKKDERQTPLLRVKMMRRIQEQLAKERNALTIFDIDETLFRTFATVKVMKDGKVVKELNNQQYNMHTLGPGETYDYVEFSDSRKFFHTSKPIGKMFRIAGRILAAKKAKGGRGRTIIITARPDFDNKHIFLQAFRKYGLDIDSIYVERAGNQPGSSAQVKKKIINQYIKDGKYQVTRFFDDSTSNLDAFLSLKKTYPDITFEAFHVDDNGVPTRYKYK